MNRPINPYVTDAPLREGQDLFGRQDTLEWVARELCDPATNSLVLFGQRCIGKTSLLRQLERVLPPDAFLPVYFDLQDRATRPLGQVLADLAGTLAKRAGLKPLGLDLFDDQGRFFLHTFLPRFQTVASKGRRLVFLLDEFDVLYRADEVELAETAAVETLFPFLRDVMAGEPRPACVFAAGRRVDDLARDLAATFGTSLVWDVGPLDWESAGSLVRQAEANGTLRFTDLTVSHILGLTNGHPHLTQLLCQRTWERAYAGTPLEPPLIDMLAVDAAVTDALEAGDQALAWVWNGLSQAEKIYASALAGVTAGGEPVSEAHVVQAIADQSAWLHTPEVELAPRDLVKRRVLEEAGERAEECKQRFVVELFRRWVSQNKPLYAVADELDWVKPPDECLFEVGKGFFDEWQWETAVDHFRDTLEANPHHFRARLHLGESLLELGQIEEAITELERAYELDQEKARLSLARARAAQVQAQGGGGSERSALTAAGQPPPLSSGEQPAQETPVTVAARQDDVDIDVGAMPVSTVRAIGVALSQWMGRTWAAFTEANYAEAAGLLLPVVVTPVLSAFVFYGIGISLARGMSNVSWLPPLFDASTFHRFGWACAILGLFPGFQFSYEFIKQPLITLELVYLSLGRFTCPFLVTVLIYAVLTLLAWVSQSSISADERASFQIFLILLQRLWEVTRP